MPFPWKKSKITRISRLVSGLHKTPKHGGSLVVETGFPTSLIDLFVKNRDRLRRSSKRKSDPRIVLSDPTRSYPLPPCNREIQIQSVDDTDARESVSIARETDDNEKKNENKIELHLVFEISLTVAFAVCTGNLAIWVTMALFLFVGFEFFGSRYSKPRSNELLLERVEPERDVEREVTEFTDGLIELEDGLKMGCDLSRSARIKSSLIKKFVPKKLRYRNKKNPGKLEKETHVEEEQQQEEPESETELIIVPTTTTTCDQNDQNLPIQSAEKEKNLRKGNSGYLILFIVVVVLAGLIGGRGVALLLTLVCYLMIPICIRTRQSDADADLDSDRKTR